MVQAPVQHGNGKSVRFATATTEVPSTTAQATTLWTALPGGILGGGEIVLLAIKPSMWRPLFDSAAWLVTCGLLAAVLLGLGRPIPGLSSTATAQVILMAGLARMALAIIRWVPRWHVLTNRRIIDVRGVRSPRVAWCPLLEIRNTYLHSTLAEKIASLGTITFVTTHEEQPSRQWRSIAKPDEVHDKIRRAIGGAIDQHQNGV